MTGLSHAGGRRDQGAEPKQPSEMAQHRDSLSEAASLADHEPRVAFAPCREVVLLHEPGNAWHRPEVGQRRDAGAGVRGIEQDATPAATNPGRWYSTCTHGKKACPTI